MASVKPRLEKDDCNLESARVGQEMHSLVHVDTDLPLVAIIPSHGKYLQFKVNLSNIRVSEDLVIQKDLLFIALIHERNRKDSLYNRIVQFFDASSVGLLDEEILLSKKLVTCLRDIFWYLDGHHHVFERINKPISSFDCFVGYNVPELSKHQKRLTKILSSDQLRSLAIDFSAILLESYWEKPCWRNTQQQFIDLSESLGAYSDYLVEKNKKVKANHRSPTPVRELSENLHLKFLAPTEQPVPTILQAIDELLQSLVEYKYLSITYLLPLDSLKKHRLLNLLISSGLSSPSMLLIYNPGGGIRNLQFLW